MLLVPTTVGPVGPNELWLTVKFARLVVRLALNEVTQPFNESLHAEDSEGDTG